MLSTNQFRNGNHIDVDGTIFKIVEFQHVKPGKGGAFVRTKLRRASDGAVIDRTFRAGEKFRSVRTEVRRMQFLYRDGTDAHFMDTESYDQLTIPEADAGRRAAVHEGLRRGRAALHRRRSRPTCSCRARSTCRCPRPSPGSAATPPRVAGPSRPCSRPAPHPGATVRQHRRPRARRHPVGRVRLACLTRLDLHPHMRRTEQRRAAVWALYQSDLLGRELDDSSFGRDTRGFTRALADLVRTIRPSSTT